MKSVAAAIEAHRFIWYLLLLGIQENAWSGSRGLH
jgi:hypothetical protein